MRIAYYDEAGEDGFPKYSSPLFVLTSAYIPYLKWRETYEKIRMFRRELKLSYNFPIKMEMHAKKKIKRQEYDVLDISLSYSIQRIENDLNLQNDPNVRFMIITDDGRIGKMRKTARKMQSINFIPSKFSPSPYRNDIKLMIEDPLPKDSKESYFIQLSDLVAHVVYLFSLGKTGAGEFSNRLKVLVDRKRVLKWMDYLKPVFNLKASNEEYGIVYHPK